jgi:hypothetical protein
VRHSSPTRRISPELARKAAKFAGGAAPAVPAQVPRSPVEQAQQAPKPSSPAPSVCTSDTLLTKLTASSAPAPLPPQPFHDVDDPLAEIERRRTLRRQALEAFQCEIEQSKPSWGLGDPHSARGEQVNELSEATPSQQSEKPLPVPADRASTVDPRISRSVTPGLPILHEVRRISFATRSSLSS